MKRSVRQPARSQASRPRRGIGLVEAAVATVVVGIVLVSAMATFDATLRAGQVTTNRTQAAALASTLMSEILTRRYEEPTDAPVLGRETGETATGRDAWDDVDDYDGFAQTPPTDPGGAEIPGVTKWSWKASVAYADVADPNRVATFDTGLKRITVTVTDQKGEQIVYVALRSRHNPRDRVVTTATSFVGQVGVHLQVGGGNRAHVTSAATLVNEPAP